MKYFLVFFFLTGTLFGQSTVVVGLTLPSFAKMDIEPNKNDFNLALNSPTEAGSSVTNQNTNSTKWINFTSAVVTDGTRTISAKLSGSTISGLNLRMGISNYMGGGDGDVGTSVSSIILNSTSQAIINDIGGAYTGNGINNGYNLTYSLEVSDFGQLRNVSKTFSILFTMADN